MEYWFRPWRYAYVSGQIPRSPECLFCRLVGQEPGKDRDNLVVGRAGASYAVLNRFPYNPGHLMIVPERHVARLAELQPVEHGELMAWLARVETVLREVYRPDGINVGLNLGRPAGAGIEAHLHIHVVPRWNGDTNFMTVMAETRVLPETLEQTWEKLRPRLQGGPGA